MAGKIFIALDRLTSILKELSRKLDVWVPAASHEDKKTMEFLPYRPGMVPILDRQSTLPPKKILLPQAESLLRFDYQKDPANLSRSTIHLDDPMEVRPALVFGARPCDVRGFLTLDRAFTGGPYVDPYYRKRRENTLFATLVCREADAACFCSSVGSGPSDMGGSDFRLTPLEEGYLLEALNERAQSLLDSVDCLADRPGEEQEQRASQIIAEVCGQQVGTLAVEGSAGNFLKRFEEKTFWQDMALQCLGCGICTYVCPTCYCFTITDEMKNLQGERLRTWDSCMFYHYTLEASGHNPRPTKLERYRNRVGHKFSYIPDKYEGWIGCCGCGRCIRSCPVSIDIRMVVQSLKEEVGENA
jgi:sulfhydrogenase subunit beta (sulfur reductase)